MNEDIITFMTNLTTVANFVTVPPVLIFIYRWAKHQLSDAQRFFGITLSLVCLVQLSAFAVSYKFHLTNLPLYHLYILIEGAGLILLFRYRFSLASERKKLLWLAIIYSLYIPVNTLFFEDFFQIPNIARSIESVIIIVFSLLYFHRVFMEMEEKRLIQSFWFWLSAGLMLYFTSNLLLFMFTNVIFRLEDELFFWVWSIHATLNFILYTFYTIGLLCQDQKS